MQSHQSVFDNSQRDRLSAILEKAQPYVAVHSGASWVVDVDGRTAAIWSQQHGVELLVPDDPIGRKPHQLYFHYFGPIDPTWLHQRLREGAPPHRQQLEEEYRPLAKAAMEREQRRREREIPARLLTDACMKALVELGAMIDLHNDRLLRFDLNGRRWAVQKIDSMTLVSAGSDEGLRASIRPAAFAECWLLVAAAGETRAAHGLPHLPAYTPNPAPVLESMTSRHAGTPSWTTTKPELIAQLTGERAVDYFRLAIGRQIPEIVSIMIE